jgi:DNA-directed RNA polymerase subunit RPC12/RpoP
MSAPPAPVKPGGIPIDHDPWYRCPACGSEAAPRGERGDVIFADGRQGNGKPFRLQEHTWRLTCPCGHRWCVQVTWTNVAGTRYTRHTAEAWDGYIRAKRAYADHLKERAAARRSKGGAA